MKTLTLEQAAELLKCSAATVRRKAKRGEVPGRKVGRCWVFVEEHLADWISGRFPLPAGENDRLPDAPTARLAELQLPRKTKPYRPTKASRSGISSSQTVTDAEYSALLERKTGKPRKNCTTGDPKTK